VSPSYFTLESLVGLKPDFLFAGWNYGLQTGTSLTPDNFTRYGIKTLVLAESCAHVPPGPNSVSINDTYQDLPVTVFDYDSGQSAPFTGPGLAMPTALITLGGGTNIFGSLRQSWTSVSWEQVVRARPRCIIINDYGTPTAAQKEKFLETSPVTRNLPAVRNRCFLPLAYDEVTPGPRNAEAVVAIARWLPPTSFGRAADGS
jgi:iron complex transport system substrate-binding protein